jgi:carboxypeptidase family protein
MRRLSSTVSTRLPRKNSRTATLKLILLAACLAAAMEGIAQSRVEGAGSITGRVFDEQGGPAAGARVMAYGYFYNDHGARVIRPSGNAVTSMAGEFRISGLRPGEYIIAVERDSVPAFNPGTEDFSKAVPVRIQVGEEHILDDIRMLPPHLATVRLHIIDSTGEPKPARTVSWSTLPGTTHLAKVSAGDEATIPNLPPGTYEFAVGWETSKGPVSGHTTVEVRGPDVERDLEVRPNHRLTGRVLLEESDTETSPLANVTAMLLGGSVIPSNGRYSGVTRADGVFEIDGVPEGSYAVRFFDLARDAYVSSATEGTHDFLTQPLRITGATTVAVFVRRDGGAVDGVVTDSRGTKIPDAVVALVPDGLAREEVNRYRSAITDPDGAFTIEGITPGSYHLFAWPELDGAAYRNAAFMRAYEGKGEPVHVQRGDRLSVQVLLEDN